MLHFERFIPTLYSIAREENMDLGVADDMLMACIREGRAVYRGADEPKPLAPDYATLKTEYDRMEAAQEQPGANAEFNAFIKKRQAYFPQLSKLWMEGRHYAMIDRMATDDGNDYGIGAHPSTLEEALEAARKPFEGDGEVTEDGD